MSESYIPVCATCGDGGLVELTPERQAEEDANAEYYRLTGIEPITMDVCPACGGSWEPLAGPRAVLLADGLTS